MVTYDPRYMEWDEWCPLMSELFASQQLGIAPEEDWQQWADGMAGISNFMADGIPDSRGFDDWRDWASALVGIVNVGR